MNSFNIFIIGGKESKPIIYFFDSSTHEITGVTKFEIDNNLDQETIKMIESDLVVTAGNWYEEESCTQLVQIARILKKEVIHETKLTQYVKEKYDR